MESVIIDRRIYPEAKQALTQFRALCLTGPRQSGKTTLSKLLFPNAPYVNFENPSVQAEAEDDPKVFLSKFTKGAVLDEVQRVPAIFRYLQEILDENRKRGQFILTGSNNFLLQEKVSQSLAGRAGYLSLLPFSYAELLQAGMASNNVNQHLLQGGYPEIWSEGLAADVWLRSYVQTYVQRDVRLLRNITNLGTFNRFIQLCATYAGQIVNRDDLGRQTGVDTKTVQAWLGLLENSYVVYQLQPWFDNMNKRIVKSPKLYFHDTGLLCHLLGIKTLKALQSHKAYGSLFENWVLSEIRKNRSNAGIEGGMYYFRDNAGNEVDLILEQNGEPVAMEIKSAVKTDGGMLRGLRYWQKLRPRTTGILVFGGERGEDVDDYLSTASWKAVADL